MVGKGTLLVILGFSIIFGLASQYWNRTSTEATENFVDYYDSTAAHNIAVSAANIAADSIFHDPSNTHLNWSGSFSGGSYSFSSEWNVVDGDSDVLVTAIGTYPAMYGNIVDTVQVLLSPCPFDRYAFFSNDENSTYWITGDTLTGPLHTNGTLYVSGVPVIKGSATSLNGTDPAKLPDTNGDTLKCTSYQSGVNIPIPSSLTATENAASKVFSNTDTYSRDTYDVYLTFNADGTVTYHTTTVTYPVVSGRRRKTTVTTQDSTVAVSTFAPSGVALVVNGDVHVQGVLDGEITVAAEQGVGSSSTNWGAISLPNYITPPVKNGNVLIDGSITYKNNPQNGPSTDMLGLVADNSVMLTTQSTQNMTIDGAIFAKSGEFLYQNYNGGSPMGYLDLYGAITNNIRGAVGTFSGHTLQTGYNKDYVYDSRFATTAPPFFPTTGQFQILAWRE